MDDGEPVVVEVDGDDEAINLIPLKYQTPSLNDLFSDELKLSQEVAKNFEKSQSVEERKNLANLENSNLKIAI